MLEGCAHFWPFFEVTFSPVFWVFLDKTKTRKPSKIKGFRAMVPVTGLEPVRCCHRGILSPLRLPIPPHRRVLTTSSIIQFRKALVKGFYLLFFICFYSLFSRSSLLIFFVDVRIKSLLLSVTFFTLLYEGSFRLVLLTASMTAL